MDDRVIQLRVGVVVVAAMIIGTILVIIFYDGGLFTSQYTLQQPFDSAPGVTVDTPVRLNGVLVGRVSNVELLDEGGVIVSVRIDADRPIRKDHLMRIGTGSIFGDPVLEVVQGEERLASPGNWTDGDVLPRGAVGSNPMQVIVDLEDDMRIAIASITQAGNDVSKTSQSMEKLLSGNTETVDRVLRNSDLAITELRDALKNFDDVFGDEQLKANLKQSINGMPALLADARTSVAAFQSAAEKAEANLDHLEGIMRPLGERGDELADYIEGSMANLDILLAQLAEFSKAMNNREGTLGRLVYDRELYDRIERIVGNVEDVTYEIRPILADVRVFSDKIARDPRQLGLKGALDARPSGTGSKLNFHRRGSALDNEPAFQDW